MVVWPRAKAAAWDVGLGVSTPASWMSLDVDSESVGDGVYAFPQAWLEVANNSELFF